MANCFLLNEETSPFELGFQLNDTLLSAVESAEPLDYGKPRAAFRALVGRSTAPCIQGLLNRTPNVRGDRI